MYTQTITILHALANLLSGVVVDSVSSVFTSGASSFSFSVVTKCDSKSCPGSFYTSIATAFANIGYLTHADVLRFLNTSHFGKWAILLYIGAAITGLLGVATNSPMRNYTWFFIGPALFSFLVGTTMPVTGVNWVVANRAYDMSEVWKNAEAGLANTRLAIDGKIKIDGANGPTGQYEVAMPMVFLDELFSATSNILIEWTGIGRQVAGTGSNTNLANPSGSPQGEGPWWLLSTLKWGYIEDLVSTTARNPDVRDALVTFLGSECGEKLKDGINSAAYIAATQARGSTPVNTVIKGAENGNYDPFIKTLSSTSIPTPRSVNRLFREKDATGSFRRFSKSLKDAKAYETGRTHGIVCSEYLWVIIQALRFEAGSAFYQTLRKSPNGLKREEFVNTVIYAWDVKDLAGVKPAGPLEQEAFFKHLILAYLIRNELLYAPQITSVDQRFAPSQQSRSYSDAYVRSYGSKSKFIELYNAAIMMPYLQGILAYLLVVAYPLACMMVILPGHYKAFFTWVSFFAWIKLWDVGFAVVQVIERSVWAMTGNNGHMASTARVLIKTANEVGGIAVEAPFRGPLDPNSSLGKKALAALEAIPVVCSLQPKTIDGKCGTSEVGFDQPLDKAMELFDKMLLTSANIDLDVSNGWYIYIMSALYLAVPAVTGQLVLGAKAGSASMVKDAFSGVGNDGANAAKTGAQHKDVAAMTANSGSLGQAAYAAAMRKADGKKPSLMAQGLAAGNAVMDLGVAGSNASLVADSLGKQAGVADKSLQSYQRGWNQIRAGIGVGTGVAGAAAGGQGGTGSGAGATSQGRQRLGAILGKDALKAIESGGEYAGAGGAVALGKHADKLGVEASAAGMDASWRRARADQAANGLREYKGSLGSQANFEAESEAWHARNQFASHAAAQAGIAGMNAGTIAPGQKPQDQTGMAMSGMLNNGFDQSLNRDTGRYTASAPAAGSFGDVSGAASYAGTGFQTMVADNEKRGIEHNGSSMIMGEWTGNAAGGSFGLSDTAKTAGAETAKQTFGIDNPDVNTAYVQSTGIYADGSTEDGAKPGANFFKPSSPVGEGERPKLDVGNVESVMKAVNSKLHGPTRE